jgi:ribosomal protein S18 acetylase RimI-like enzyme
VQKPLLPFMLSDDHPAVQIRPMVQADLAAVANLVASAGNFNEAEVECALELVDIYLTDRNQTDYRVMVAEGPDKRVCAYVCWGPVPLTKGTYDLYWIATHPDFRGFGFGHKLMSYVEGKVRENMGRLLVVETSSKQSYQATIEFYHRLGYEEASRIRDFYDIGDDKLVFVKKIPGQGD